ncbi:hypothetical protein KW785_01255 [Candidatus Parcubacteria bacterium]|nr:hypothetical protein [Candidatus Parcubacteria bacterium]
MRSSAQDMVGKPKKRSGHTRPSGDDRKWHRKHRTGIRIAIGIVTLVLAVVGWKRRPQNLFGESKNSVEAAQVAVTPEAKPPVAPVVAVDTSEEACAIVLSRFMVEDVIRSAAISKHEPPPPGSDYFRLAEASARCEDFARPLSDSLSEFKKAWIEAAKITRP